MSRLFIHLRLRITDRKSSSICTSSFLFLVSTKNRNLCHSHPQSSRSFWPAAGIESSGLLQHRKSTTHGLPIKSGKSDWLRIRNENSAHAQKIGSHGLTVTLRMLRVTSEKSDWLIVRTNSLRMLRKSDPTGGRDCWCWRKGVQPLRTRMLFACMY